MKTFFKYSLIYVSALALLPLTTACSDDESTDPYDVNYVYMYSPSKTDNSLVYKGNGVFLTGIAEKCVINPVKCTKPAPTDVTVHFDIAPSLVDSYNQEHGTNYTLLKSAQLENSVLSIKRGDYISADTLKVNFTDLTEFQSGAENFILPITVTEMEGAGVSLSQNSKIYLTFTSTYKPNRVMIASSSEKTLYIAGGEVIDPENPDKLTYNSMLSCEWPADADMTLSLEIQPELIEAYNAKNSTNYKLLPNASLETTTMHIAKGDMGAMEVLTLLSSDKMASVKPGENYIVPIKVTEVTGEGGGVYEEKSECYLLFNAVKMPNIISVSQPVGTLENTMEDWNSWSVYYNGGTTDGFGKDTHAVFQPTESVSNKMYRAFNLYEPLTFDLSKTYNISSFDLTYYFSYSSYAASHAKIETSVDGETYEADDIEMPYRGVQIFKFSRPKNIRYIRITFTSMHSSSTWSVYLSAFRFYTTK